MPRPNTVPKFAIADDDATANRHPVDQLADVRAEIKTLKTREEQLRDKILSGACGEVGDQYVARIDRREKRTIDVDLLTRHFGAEALKPFFKTTSFETIRLAERQPQQEG